MTRIFLVGYMGAGKTTLGRALAQSLKMEFIDLDWYIEGRFHKSVSELFAQQGEERFRLMEQQLLHEVAEFENTVISTGGGTPCHFDNMEFMCRMGKTLFLDASEKALLRRLKAGRQKRPLLRGKTDEELITYIRCSLEERLPFYRKATYRIVSDRLESHQQIADTIAETLQILNLKAD